MQLRFWRIARSRRTAPRPSFFRPTVEGMEDRIVMQGAGFGAHALVAPAQSQSLTSLLPLTVSNVVVDATGAVTGLVSLGSATAPLTGTLTLSTSSSAACPILNLHLDPIHLNLLGLVVDTSPICLTISAQPGQGQLLGNLLCSVGDLLNGTTGTFSLSQLPLLPGINLSTVVSDLNSIVSGALSGVFSGLTNPVNITQMGGGTAANGNCNVLNLSVGAINLDALGLVVQLNNCNATNPGPVTVDITAQRGPGNLLGNLLCGVANALNGPAGSHLLSNLFGNLNNLLGRLL